MHCRYPQCLIQGSRLFQCADNLNQLHNAALLPHHSRLMAYQLNRTMAHRHIYRLKNYFLWVKQYVL